MRLTPLVVSLALLAAVPLASATPDLPPIERIKLDGASCAAAEGDPAAYAMSLVHFVKECVPRALGAPCASVELGRESTSVKL